MNISLYAESILMSLKPLKRTIILYRLKLIFIKVYLLADEP